MADEIQPIETPAANRLAAGAPGTVTLGELVYLIAQPSDADMVTIWKHLTSVWKQRHNDPLGKIMAAVKGLPANVQEIAIREAVRLNDGNMEPDNAALTPLLLEPAGVAFAYWLLINKAGQAVPLAAVSACIDDANVDDYVATFMRAVSLRDAAPN